jgi:very-short-patch-repair endonuclease
VLRLADPVSLADLVQRDRARDRALNVAGWRVVRVTWRQLASEPEALATDLRRLLGSLASSR